MFLDCIGIRDATRISPRLMVRVVVSGPPIRASSVFLDEQSSEPCQSFKNFCRGFPSR